MSTDQAPGCANCKDKRKVRHEGQAAGPCHACSFVLTRYRPVASLDWSPASLLSFTEALDALGEARRNGAVVYGMLHHGDVEYITGSPEPRRWQFHPITREEGRAWKAAHEVALTTAQNRRYGA